MKIAKMVAAALLLGVMVGCSSPQSRLPGTWVEEGKNDTQHYIEFFSDNTVAMESPAGPLSGKWVVLSDGRIKADMKVMFSEVTVIGELKGKRLIWEMNGKKAAFVKIQKVAPISLEFRLAQYDPSEGLIEMPVEGSERKVYLRHEVLLANSDVASASVGTNELGEAVIKIALTRRGGKRLAEATERNINKSIAILVDGKIVSVPIIREKIRWGAAEISASYTRQEATRIAEGIVLR